MNLLDSFVDHWKGITNYYIETTGKPSVQSNRLPITFFVNLIHLEGYVHMQLTNKAGDSYE